MHMLSLMGTTGPIYREILKHLATAITPEFVQIVVLSNKVVVTTSSLTTANELRDLFKSPDAAEGRCTAIDGVMTKHRSGKPKP